MRFLIALVGSSLAILLAVAFSSTAVVDALAPRGATQLVTVWDLGQISPTDFRALVPELAAQHHIALVKEDVTERASGNSRTESIVNAAATSSLSPEPARIPRFDLRDHVRAVPWRDLPDSALTGQYSTDATSATAAAFVADLDERGVEVTLLPLNVIGLAGWVVSEVPVVPLAAAVLVVLVVGGAAWTVRRTRRHLLLVLHGMPSGRVGLRAAGTALAVLFSGAATAVATTVPVFAASDRLARWGLFTGVFLAGVAAATVVLLVGVGTGLLLVRPDRRLLDGLQGARPLRSLLGITLVGRAVVLLSVCSVLGGLMVVLGAARTNADDEPELRASGSFAALAFRNGNLDDPAVERGLVGLVDDLDAAGSVVVAVHPATPMYQGNGPDEGNSLIVNDAFLRRQPVDAVTGRRIRPQDVDDGSLVLLVPSDVPWTDADLADWTGWADFQSTHDGGPTGAPVDVRVLRTASIGQVFNYGNDAGDDTSSQQSPVIAVLPHERALVSVDFVVSALTQGQIVFTDVAALRREISRRGLGPEIGGVELLADRYGARARTIDRSLRWDTTAATTALAVTAVSSLGAAAITARLRRRRAFVRALHGERLTRAVLVAAVLPVTTTMVVLAAAAVDTALPASRVVLLGLAALDAVVTIGALAVLTRGRASAAGHAAPEGRTT